MDLLEMSADELLVQIEAAAATGSTRAERMLVMLLDEEARTGSQTLRRNESPRIIGTSDRR